MSKDVDWLLVTIICIIALGCALVCVICLFGSSFIVFELDYTDEQRQAANFKAGLISFLGLVGLGLSTLLFIMSVKTANFISKVLAGKISE